MRGLLLFDLQDVIAELGLDHIRSLPGLQGKRCLLKFRHSHAALDHAQLAALLLAARVIGVSLCQCGKIGAAFDLLEQVLRLLPGCGIGLCVGARRHLDQDMPHLHFFRNLIILLMGLVVLLYLLAAHRAAASHRYIRLVQGYVSQLARLRDRIFVPRRVLLKERLQLSVRGIDLLAQILEVDHRVIELDLSPLLPIGVADIPGPKP